MEDHCGETGLNTMTGGRIKRIQPYIGDEPFMLTYGDGVCDVDIAKMTDLHRTYGKLASLTSVMQEQQEGVLEIGGDNAVNTFRKKSIMDGMPINVGFVVLEPQVFDYIGGETTPFQHETLHRLAAEHQLISYSQKGFWQCMDTKCQKDMLEKMWESGQAPWKV